MTLIFIFVATCFAVGLVGIVMAINNAPDFYEGWCLYCGEQYTGPDENYCCKKHREVHEYKSIQRSDLEREQRQSNSNQTNLDHE